jgi:hypothetical protein
MHLLIAKLRRAMTLAVALLMLCSFLAQPAMAVSSTGWRWLSRCCCPDPANCHCPGADHSDRHKDDGPMMKRCANDGNVTVAKELIVIVVANPVDVPTTVERTSPVAGTPLNIPPTRFLEIETPPF